MLMKASPPSHKAGQCAGLNSVTTIAVKPIPIASDATNEPHPNASRSLQDMRDGTASAKPVEEPFLHPVAPRIGPKNTKPDRKVAIKVLPATFVQHLDRLAGLEQKAKVLASLNRPNIAAICTVKVSSEGIWMLLFAAPYL